MREQDGMMLRDYFAGQALIMTAVMLSNRADAPVGAPNIAEAVANAAYMLADAMIAERAK